MPPRRPRIAVVGVGCENATFSPLYTQLADFSTSDTEEGMRAVYEKIVQCPVGTPLDVWDGSPVPPLDVDFGEVELRYASRFRAMPGGTIAHEAYAAIKAKTQEGLEALMPVDGVWLDYHGAMKAEGVEDTEGDLTALVRRVVGEHAVLCASFDLHGNFSPRMAAAIDITTAYRTAPHVDVHETRVRALGLLVKGVQRALRFDAGGAGAPTTRLPHLAYVKVPLVLSGEMTNTADEPTRSLYSTELFKTDVVGGVWDASVLVGYCWADEPRSGASVLVTADAPEVAEREARRIASVMWSTRKDFRFGVAAAPLQELCAARLPDALARRAAAGVERPAPWTPGHSEESPPVYPVVVSDSGDNPTAGGVGDTPDALRELIAARAADASGRLAAATVLVQGPVDSVAVEACLAAGVGSTVRLSLGGKLDHLNSSPYECDAVVQHLHPTVSSYEFLYEGRTYPTSMPPSAVVDIAGISVVLCSARKPLHYFADFRELCVAPEAFDVVVIKVGYLVPDLEAVAWENLMALSPGAVFADLRTLPYRHIPRPFYPKDEDMEWAP
eukprot:TRINITY_DN3658_c0_g1_i2.p1 TRINITY_DN3658_c0_g1~~TRINITY_DN3658_c0_g1_i2.p1  ORF type:complete len:557 (+),score=176.04 TRINITY_DN3658_c0_g1_i2:751-2421(+)